MFRGRGGPTDRRLPKHNARRRKVVNAPLASTVAQEDAPNADMATAPEAAVKALDKLGAEDIPFHPLSLKDIQVSDCDSCDEAVVTIDAADPRRADTDDSVNQDGPNHSKLQFRNESNHLVTRIRRCRDTMKLSAVSLSIRSNYEKHVLRAVLNCADEWKAIVKHYPTAIEGDGTDVGSDTKATTLALFYLIQHALQCGPLAGSKAGYWKRCGSEIAAAGFAFLESIATSKEIALGMHFTQKQADALLKWKADAKNVAESGRPPAKVVHQKLVGAEKAKAEARRLNEVKKQRRIRATGNA